MDFQNFLLFSIFYLPITCYTFATFGINSTISDPSAHFNCDDFNIEGIWVEGVLKIDNEVNYSGIHDNILRPNCFHFNQQTKQLKIVRFNNLHNIEQIFGPKMKNQLNKYLKFESKSNYAIEGNQLIYGKTKKEFIVKSYNHFILKFDNIEQRFYRVKSPKNKITKKNILTALEKKQYHFYSKRMYKLLLDFKEGAKNIDNLSQITFNFSELNDKNLKVTCKKINARYNGTCNIIKLQKDIFLLKVTFKKEHYLFQILEINDSYISILDLEFNTIEKFFISAYK